MREMSDSKILRKGGRLMAGPWRRHLRKRNKFGEGWRCSKAFANGDWHMEEHGVMDIADGKISVWK